MAAANLRPGAAMHARMLATTLVLALAPEYPLAADFVPASPANYVAGGMQTPEYVIIHQQDGVYAGTIGWFQDPGSGVSTHYVMRSSDGEITQMVEHADMAQHIGGYNPVSFGIEHEGYTGEPGWFTWETYTASALLTRWLCDEFGIPTDRQHILGHVEVPGASHTDPGDEWDWDMYMALVHDVVPAARVEGVLVDRAAACVLTTTEDTWVTTTLETLDVLDDDEICFVPAGTELAYLHASDEMISQRRLVLAPSGPCAALGEVAYAWMPSFSAPCEPASLAVAHDVVVTLDGIEAAVDEEGRFVFEGVAAGAHTIDVASASAWTPTSVPIDVAVYPGLRVVVALEAALEPEPGTSGAATTGDDEGEGTQTSSTSTSGTTSVDDDGGAGDERGTSGDPSIPPGDATPGATAGCGCSAAPRGAALLWALALVGLGRRRRPR